MRNIIIIFIVLFSVSLYSEDQKKEYLLRKKIADVKHKISEYKEKSTALDRRIKSFEIAHKKRLNIRQKNIAVTKKMVSHLNEKIRKRKNNLRHLKYVRRNYQKQFSLFRQILIRKIGRYSKFVGSGMSYKLDERNNITNGLLNDLRFTSIREGEIFNRFLTFLQRELVLAFDSEVYNEGNNKYLRLGWVLLARQNVNINDVQIQIVESDTKRWESNLPFKFRQVVRDSIKMVEGKKAPELMLFPFAGTIFKIR